MHGQCVQKLPGMFVHAAFEQLSHPAHYDIADAVIRFKQLAVTPKSPTTYKVYSSSINKSFIFISLTRVGAHYFFTGNNRHGNMDLSAMFLDIDPSHRSARAVLSLKPSTIRVA